MTRLARIFAIVLLAVGLLLQRWAAQVQLWIEKGKQR